MIDKERLFLFEKAPIKKSVWELSFPTIVSMLVVVLYNMVDTFFVGQLQDPNKVAAVAVATPVFLFLMAAGNIFGVGGSTFISRALGKKEMDKVKHISSFCFYAGIVTGLAGSLIFLLLGEPILRTAGASDYTIGYASGYLRIIAWGAPLVVISNTFSNLVRGEGAAKTSMRGMLLGTFANIILDPIFILPSFTIGKITIPLIGWGVEGAAFATVLGNVFSVIYYIVFAVSDKSIMSLSLKEFKMRNGIFSGVFLIGLPASLNSVLMSMSNILLNNVLVSYGDIAIAAMGVAMKANMLVIFIQIGLSAGVQPLLGYSYGAGNKERLQATAKYTMKANVLIGFVLSIVYMFVAPTIISVFINNDEVISFGTLMLRALMISPTFLGIMFVNEFAFQAMGKAKESLLLSISRQGFVFIPVLFVAKALAGLNGIILAQPAADIASVFISLWMYRNILRKDPILSQSQR